MSLQLIDEEVTGLMTPTFTISDTETLILALPGREWLLVSCQLSVVGKKDILLSPLLPWFRDKTVVAPQPFLHYLH